MKKSPMNLFLKYSLLFLFSAFAIGCNSPSETLFRLHTSEYTDIYFANSITENDSVNVLEMEYVYNGGGVGIGDFNNDGLQDVYFTGNMVDNKLYINEGSFRFRDITVEAGVEGDGKWCAGVAVVDVNKD